MMMRPSEEPGPVLVTLKITVGLLPMGSARGRETVRTYSSVILRVTKIGVGCPCHHTASSNLF
jgi:hypothetical protein